MLLLCCVFFWVFNLTCSQNRTSHDEHNTQTLSDEHVAWDGMCSVMQCLNQSDSSSCKTGDITPGCHGAQFDFMFNVSVLPAICLTLYNETKPGDWEVWMLLFAGKTWLIHVFKPTQIDIDTWWLCSVWNVSISIVKTCRNTDDMYAEHRQRFCLYLYLMLSTNEPLG